MSAIEVIPVCIQFGNQVSLTHLATKGCLTQSCGFTAHEQPYDRLVPEHELSFGLYIGRLRDQRGLSLRQAAKRIGVSFSRLAEWERGADSHTGKPIVPPRQAVLDIARTYAVPGDELLALAGYRTSQEPATPEEVRLLAAFRRLDDAGRAQVLVDVEARTGQGSTPSR